MTRDSFVFYRSFAEAAQTLSAKERLKFFDALVGYALDGADPEISGPAAGMLILVRPVIETNNRKYENGRKGGRPTVTKEEPKRNQTETKPKPYEEEDVEEDVDVHVDGHEDGDGAFVLADGSAYFPPMEKIQEYERAFPDVDVHRELLRCQIKHNAMDQRKNVTNIERYIVNWLINAQGDAKKHKASFTDMETHGAKVDNKFWSDIGKRGGLV